MEILGKPSDETLRALRNDALFQVVLSIWYEGPPAVINEAFALGIPVVASRIGSLATMIGHGRNGRDFKAGDAGDLAEQVRALFENRSELSAMRRNARNDFLARNTAAGSFAATMKIYQAVVEARN